MNARARAIQILQDARDRLSERLTQRVVDAREEIASDAEGSVYLSEIEAIYDQIGSRLAHLNAMLSNLPPVPDESSPDATATEIIYADLASAYPMGFEQELNAQPPVLGLPAPPQRDETSDNALAHALRQLAALASARDFAALTRAISESFDQKPSQARAWAVAFARQCADRPELPRRLIDAAGVIDDVNELAAARLVSECFEADPFETLPVIRLLKRRGQA